MFEEIKRIINPRKQNQTDRVVLENSTIHFWQN